MAKLVLLMLLSIIILSGCGKKRKDDKWKTSKKDAAKTTLQMFELPLEGYKKHVGQYPSTDEGLEALRSGPTDENLKQKWRGPYMMKAIPKDPWGNEYFYKKTGAGFDARSRGRDGILNNSDDIVVTHDR